MTGVSHIVTGVASFVIITGGAALLDRSWGNPIGDVIAWCANQGGAYMMDGNLSFGIYIFICMAFYMLGVLLPDVDTSKSLIGRFAHVPIRHRTWTHSLWPVLAMLLVSWLLWRPVAWLALGYVVHLFWDSLSRQGVCWFYPVPGYLEYDGGAKVKRGHWLWFYRNGSRSETVVVVISVVIAAVVLVMLGRNGVIPSGV